MPTMKVGKTMEEACATHFTTRGIGDIENFVRDGVLRDSWSRPRATIGRYLGSLTLMVDVSPYVFEILSWISILHNEIKSHESVAKILSPTIDCIVEVVFSELLSAFRQIESFSGPGMVRAMLDTELLFQLLS